MTTDRRRISSGSPFEATVGYCRAVAVGDRIWVAGTAPIWPDGSVAGDAGDQARRCFEIIDAALTELGASLADVVRVRVYLVDAADFDAVAAVHGELFRDVRPVNTTVVVARLLDPRWKVEIEVDAIA
ncbi:MAG: RidA family protein [Ilumatobacteraceae bacterium]